MARSRFDVTDLARSYDERSPLGDELRDGHLHMWYWFDDDDEASLPEAVARVTRRVVDTLGLRPGERLLDAGCGPGSTAVLAAVEHGVQVVGVTLSRFEVERARARAADAGVAGQTSFELGDYSALEAADGSFDAVLALESLMYAADLPAATAELFRVLRPGGRLSLSDFTLESHDDSGRVAAFRESLRMNVLPTLDGWLACLRGVGFDIEEWTQCGPRVFGRKSKYLKVATRRRGEVADKFGEDAITVYSRVHQGFFLPRKDQIGYAIISARKPR